MGFVSGTTVIADNSLYLDLTLGGAVRSIPKNLTKCIINSVGDLFIKVNDGNTFRMDRSLISSPASVSNEDLRSQIEVFLNNEPAPPAGAVQVAVTITNFSVDVTGASQVLIAANANRKYLLIQSIQPNANIYINYGAAASQTMSGMGGSIELLPSSNIELDDVTIITDSVNAFGLNPGDRIVVMEGV